MAKVTYKSYNQNDNLLLPPSLGDFIPQTHPVRVVNAIIDKLDIQEIEDGYKGGGTSSYHPRMLLKVIIYSYLNNVFSGRKMEKQLSENINYMWLAGYSRPDFRTLNSFRSKRLFGKFDKLFTQIVEMLHEEGFVSLNVQYIDGTKVESVANRYTFVWGKSVESFDKRLKNKVDQVLRQAEAVIDEEEKESDVNQGMDTEDFKRRVEKIKGKLDKSDMGESEKKEITKDVKEVESKDLPKMEEYDRHREVLGGRNSYSKTDHDAIFMRMKEDYMGNGQLKPGYNVQIATENQFITNYGIYQTAGDTGTFIPFLESFKERYGIKSDEVIADSGYGSEQNYEYLLKEETVPYVKYNYFHMDIKKHNKCKSDIFKLSPLFYKEDEDCYICPMGQKMTFRYEKNTKSDLGYEKRLRVYEAQDCSHCNMRAACCPKRKSRNKIIEVNRKLEGYKSMVRELLTSEKGLEHRSKRPIEPEAVFGQIKYDCGFKRFRLKSVPKVNIEYGLVAIAHNLRKYIKMKAKMDGKGLDYTPTTPTCTDLSILQAVSVRIAYFNLQKIVA